VKKAYLYLDVSTAAIDCASRKAVHDRHARHSSRRSRGALWARVPDRNRASLLLRLPSGRADTELYRSEADDLGLRTRHDRSPDQKRQHAGDGVDLPISCVAADLHENGQPMRECVRSREPAELFNEPGQVSLRDQLV
jgi:hypothetical protein